MRAAIVLNPYEEVAVSDPAGPDLRRGVPLDAVPDGEPFPGRVGDTPVLLVRRGGEVSAVAATCPHHGAHLEEGRVVGHTLRCPWHHACFSLRTGEVLAPPALDDLALWTVVVEQGLVRVTGCARPRPIPIVDRPCPRGPRVVIVGAGAAGTAAALTLRREGYRGAVTLVDPDPDAPYDRPSLSKEYLAGQASATGLSLRPKGFFEANDIDRRVARAVRVHPDDGVVELEGGGRLFYESLLLATGARPLTLPVPGVRHPHVRTLRSLDDARALGAGADVAREVVVVGSGFLGLEAAAALRQRGVGVTVVTPGRVPLSRVLGADLGRLVHRLHVEHGVRFRLGRTVAAIHEGAVILEEGSRLPADLVLLAVGVEPDVGLAASAGLDVADGVRVDAQLRTIRPGIWAAGDGARFPHPRTGRAIRVEHWAVAQRQGSLVARNMLGAGETYDAPPFFWTRLYDTSIAYVGHAGPGARIEVEGDPEGGDGAVRFFEDDTLSAVATVGRDRAGLDAEAELEALWSRSAATPAAAGAGPR